MSAGFQHVRFQVGDERLHSFDEFGRDDDVIDGADEQRGYIDRVIDAFQTAVTQCFSMA